MTQYFTETYLAETTQFDCKPTTVAGHTCPAIRRGIGARLAASLVTFWRWHVKARQHQALLELDDHLLADIGITRDEAKKQARIPFWL